MSGEKYIISITKEEVGEMPVASFPGVITLIDTPTAAHTALRLLSGEKAIGFDTETKPAFRKGYMHHVALMQLSTNDRCFLFRLNKTGFCAELKQLLENPDILKIGVSVHDDIGAIRRTEDINPQGFIDLQSLVKDFDIADISLQKIYAIVFGERISKGQRLSNWEADTLSDAQQTYAAIDAWACLKLYEHLQRSLFDPLSSPYRHIALPLQKSISAEESDGTSTQAKDTTQLPPAAKSKNARRRQRKKAEERPSHITAGQTSTASKA